MEWTPQERNAAVEKLMKLMGGRVTPERYLCEATELREALDKVCEIATNKCVAALPRQWDDLAKEFLARIK